MSECAQGFVIAGQFVPTALLIPTATLIGICIPLIYNRLVLSRKDSHDVDQKRFENSRDLLADGIAKAGDFAASITKALKKPKPSLDDVLAIMKAGEVYFATLKVMAQAVLGGRVSDETRTHDFVPKIAEALEKSLPAYYESLKIVCSKVGLPFEGKFKEENYEGLFRVLDLYDHESWIRARQKIAGAPA